eukprot:10311831-Alexandrium_andersonii.AAC.1
MHARTRAPLVPSSRIVIARAFANAGRKAGDNAGNVSDSAMNRSTQICGCSGRGGNLCNMQR